MLHAVEKQGEGFFTEPKGFQSSLLSQDDDVGLSLGRATPWVRHFILNGRNQAFTLIDGTREAPRAQGQDPFSC